MCNTLSCLVAALLVGSATATSQPTLGHNAPFLGHTLELTVDAAPASQPLVLFYSPHAGDSATPWGTLEIERASSQRIALGTTDAQGHAAFAIPIPADASLAENEAHFQALIDDPSAPAGKTLSHGVHVRLLGTRAYVGTFDGYGNDPEHFAGMDIVSTMNESVVASMVFATPSYTHSHPVFRHNFATGAVVDGRNGLVLFDPFFGTIRARLQFQSCSETLLTDAAEEHVFVLETMGRITEVELATGAVSRVLDLPVGTGLWCANDRRTEAFLGEYHGAQLGSFVRRIDLVALADRGTMPVANGSPRHVVSGLAFADRRVVTTSGFIEGTFPQEYDVQGAVTRIDLHGPQPVISVDVDDRYALSMPVLSVASDRIVASGYAPHMMGPPDRSLRYTSLSHSAPLDFSPQVGALIYWAMVPQGSGVWFTGYGSPDPADPAYGWVFFVDLTDFSMTSYGAWYPPPHDLAVARDGYVDCTYVGLPGNQNPYPGEPSTHGPAILVIDHAKHTQRFIPLDHSPETIRVIEVP